MAVYYLPTLIALYTANAVYSSTSDFKVLLSMFCATLLFSSARGAVTMTAFTLHDHGQHRLQTWRLLPWLLYFAWLQFGVIWRRDRKLTVSTVYYFAVLLVPSLYVLVAKPRAATLDYETREFAYYMVRESMTSSPSPFFDGDANRLYDGCKYPILVRDGRWINFSDVLSSDCTVDADVCLSYSFCRLLARRYFGFPCPEDGNTQVRDFVLTELLADCNRAFRIVEVQLALLHDYFFTNYHSEITSGFVSKTKGYVKLVGSSLFRTLLIVVVFLILGSFKGGHSALTVFLTSVPVDIMLTVIMQPKTPFLPRYWHSVRNLFLYFPTVDSDPSGPSIIHRSSAATLNQQSSQSSYYWRDKMGQYSVMEDYDRRSPFKAIIECFKVRVLTQASYSFIKHHPAAEKDVSVPGRANTTTSDALYNTTDSLRRLIARTIKDINGPPTIGTRSLGFYRDMTQDDLSWTCKQETVTHTILIWHIATCYCETPQPPEETPQQSQDEEEPSIGYRKLATTLSRYCAYLVAFLPELLPEHSLTAKVVLQEVLLEPKVLLGRTRMSMEAKRSMIQQLQLPEDESSSLTTFQKGVRLGRQLEQQPDVSLRWRAMAEFWAEMILYIASSPDNAPAHIQQLAQGGEFMTHLWALLCNAGIIMKRPTEEGTSTPA
ncbi:unnamed protein product [Urochloa decumbens]|uniref:DUF4220 domain-containing protein n=1 Tax=Urochloa decumbens TaxID=240449 RepID=A0ABC9AQ41_9POAL